MWLDDIEVILRDGLGTREQKGRAWKVAQQIDKADVPEWFRKTYKTWCYHFGYMTADPFPTYQELPFSVLTGPPPLRDGRPMSAEARDQAREARVARAKAAIDDGWPDDEAITFVCAKEEWDEVMRHAKRVAA
jgi:hypothetical protein